MSKWFEEKLEEEAGRVVKIQYRELIESFNSNFQKIDIYKTIPFGKMLVHDEVIMLTESDESHYHEMIAHVPMFTHKNPAQVLIIGGGDGGTLREILKHESVKSAHLCEIDRDVVRLSKKHFPELSCSFKDERVEVFYEDGAEFVKNKKGFYDLIIVDSSDPIGPAEILFQEEFYQSMNDALQEDGMVVTQSESFLYHSDIIEKIAKFSRKIFAHYYYYYTMVPTYPSGVIGFSFCSKKYNPVKDFNPLGQKPLQGLKYYNREIHQASFKLPNRFKNSF
jgi:spermidine synthase